MEEEVEDATVVTDEVPSSVEVSDSDAEDFMSDSSDPAKADSGKGLSMKSSKLDSVPGSVNKRNIEFTKFNIWETKFS